MRAVRNFIQTLIALFAMIVFYQELDRERNYKRILVLRPGDAAPMPIDARLSGIVIAYKNDVLIADQVAPRRTVSTKEFKYVKHDLGEGFTLPDNKIGRKSEANKVEFTGTMETDLCEDYGLEDVIPQDDIDNAPAGDDPEGRAVEGIANYNDLNREKRVSDLIFNTNSYAAGNQEQLAGTTQFSAFTTSDPITKLNDALDSMVMRGNIIVFGQKAWSYTRRHPDIVSAVLGNSGTKGMVSKQQFADLFEIDEVLVGPAWLNTAKKGQTPVLSRVWGNHISILCRDVLADLTNRVTFALTAQFGDKVAYRDFNNRIGLKGAVIVKAGDSVKELVTAKDLGYLFQDAVA